jgi:hypothetical protein
LLSINIPDIDYFYSFLLLLSGDIETNPGPTNLNHVNNFGIFHLNIRSLRNKTDFVIDLVDEYQILCFTETHLDENYPNNKLLIPGFSEPYRLDRNMFGGGVAIYVSPQLISSRQLVLENNAMEFIWVKICYNKNQSILILKDYLFHINTYIISRI